MDSEYILGTIPRFTIKDGKIVQAPTTGELVSLEAVRARLESYDYDIKSKIKEFIDGL